MKRKMSFAYVGMVLGVFLHSQPVSSAIWYDIRGPYGNMGATVSVGSLHIDEATCQATDTCGFIGTGFSDPLFAEYTFDFSIPATGPTYDSGDLVSAAYGIGPQGQLIIDGDLSDGEQIVTDQLNGIFTIAGFNVQYEAIAAPAAVPLPATLPLYGGVLALSALYGWRRRCRKAKAVESHSETPA